LFRDAPELPSANLEEVESLLGENVPFECILHISPPASAMIAGLAGMLAVSIRKSSSVARDFS